MAEQNPWVQALENQYNSSLTMLEQAITACPDSSWESPMWHDPLMGNDFSRFWYITYHALFYVDLYLSGTLEGFAPPPPFTLDELDPAGVLPERSYKKEELLAYLEHSRIKCQKIFNGMTEKTARRKCKFAWLEMEYAELLVDNLRHLQDHTAQLNMFLGQQAGIRARWK